MNFGTNIADILLTYRNLAYTLQSEIFLQSTFLGGYAQFSHGLICLAYRAYSYLLCLSTLTNPTQCCRMLPRPRLSLCLPQFLRKAVWLKTTGVMNHVWRRRWKVPHALPRVNLAILVYHAWNKHSKLSWCAPPEKMHVHQNNTRMDPCCPVAQWRYRTGNGKL